MTAHQRLHGLERLKYCGLLLKGDFSRNLRAHVSACLRTLVALEEHGSFGMNYISAWREGEESIWYEFASRDFTGLFRCEPWELRDLFRNSIIDRRIYRYSDEEAGVRQEILSSSELVRIRGALRSEAKESGTLEAVYKVGVPDGSVIWLKDRAHITLHHEDKICLSMGTLMDVSKEMEMEDELLETKKKLQRLNEQLELRVEERTARLKRLNTKLRKEIGQRKKVEARLLQAQKMEALGTLAGGIAHDFNNLLAAMLGYTQLAMIETSGPKPKREYLNEVLKAGERAEDLVRQILAFSRQAEQKPQPMLLEPIIKETVKLLRVALPSGIDIRQNIAERCGIVNADPTKIHQVLLNLCLNAAHAMRDGGGVMEVSLSAAVLDGHVEAFHKRLKPGPYVRLSVSDTGKGMTPQVLQRVFDPYFTTKEPGEGTGLGLSVVHGIVDSHGGAIAVSSEPGRGSVFHVYLPSITAAIAPEAETGTRLKRGRGRILLVDGEEALAHMGKRMLDHLGYEAVVRTSGADALTLFQSDPHGFAAVLADMLLPKMKGAWLAEKILEIRPDIPVLLITGTSERMAMEMVRGLGISGFVMKPFAVQDLGETLWAILKKNRPRGARKGMAKASTKGVFLPVPPLIR